MANESEYLARQASEARTAISRVLTNIQGDLKRSADVRLWAREYPLATTGAAVVAGLAAALSLVPSREKQALRKLARFERELTPEERRPRAQEKPPGMLFRLGRELIGSIAPALTSAISAGFSARAAQENSSHDYAQEESAAEM